MSIYSNFWDHTIPVPPSDCLLWTAGASKAGYGQCMKDGRVQYAHRLAWELTNGIAVPNGLEVRHRCDTPLCVNPRHLELGTHADNGHDVVLRGRNPGKRGATSSVAKLTWLQVREIRTRYAAGGISHRTLAAEYGISNRNISAITRGDTWIEGTHEN